MDPIMINKVTASPAAVIKLIIPELFIIDYDWNFNYHFINGGGLNGLFTNQSRAPLIRKR
jgi:hypothetical protein